MAHLISAIHLENFKAFARPTTVRLAPLTLIFGANSAGKSTILQALYLLQQSSEHRTGPEDPPLAFGGKGAICDLGNFGEAVSHGELRREMVLGIELAESRYGVSWRFGSLDSDAVASDHELRCITMSSQDFREPITDFRPAPHATGLSGEEDPEPHARRRAGRYWRFGPINESWFRDAVQRVQILSDGAPPRGLDDPIAWRRWTNRGGAGDAEAVSAALRSWRNAAAHRLPEQPHREAFATAYLRMLNSWHDLAPAGIRTSPHSITEAWPSTQGDINPISRLRRTNRHALHILSEAQCLGPMREPPRRLYPAGIGGYSASDRYLGADVAQRLHRSRSLKPEVNQWLEQLGVGYRIETIGVPASRNPIAVQLRLHPLSSRSGRGAGVALTDVGYGVSQLLPIVANTVALRNSLLTIEQPEVHIHPKLQAQLGNLLVHSATRQDGNQLIIETHSEHLILRLMRLVRQGRLKPSDISVLHVGSIEGEGAVVTELPLDERGRFLEAWPEGFFDERLEEMVD
jgi:hypothetical protein